MPSAQLMKVCPKPTCPHEQRPQPVENFHRNKSTPDGRQGYCRECMRAWRRASYDRDKERLANQRHWKRRQAYQQTYMKEYRQGKRRRQQ
jgi:hypothetical protein